MEEEDFLAVELFGYGWWWLYS